MKKNKLLNANYNKWNWQKKRVHIVEEEKKDMFLTPFFSCIESINLI